eukprot:NODE_10589_length_504_cov_33.818898_g9939_i0.p1 GENE.NODE_10589_length_504_cov_33.818898_g9939_i0~~NODE_10589_length_504_cov_33.818898_g9939_i0.p1  ORF type:complete len:136 (+),score=16.93 NODE_10589_length_504_cov_33.818898_g9939_i0:70-477(+)
MSITVSEVRSIYEALAVPPYNIVPYQNLSLLFNHRDIPDKPPSPPSFPMRIFQTSIDGWKMFLNAHLSPQCLARFQLPLPWDESADQKFRYELMNMGIEPRYLRPEGLHLEGLLQVYKLLGKDVLRQDLKTLGLG